MQKSTLQYRPVREFIYISAIIGAALVCAPTQATEPFEVMMHKDDVYGARAIESGDYALGIERLRKRLDSGAQSNSVRSPIVIDLCAGYTMLKNFEDAERYCDEAIAIGWNSGLAYNNRGALNIARGDYMTAINDFQAALDANGADAVARRNLQRVETKVAAMLEPITPTVARVSDSQ
jgi:Flp pilus assembly protein TadD